MSDLERLQQRGYRGGECTVFIMKLDEYVNRFAGGLKTPTMEEIEKFKDLHRQLTQQIAILEEQMREISR